MHDGFGILVRGEHVAPRLKIRSMVGVVIDFAVEDNLECPILIGHRLVSRRQIDDAQAAMGETNGALDEQACVIGSAMLQDVAHPDERRLAYG